mmetsp:Transcript_23847/g.42316  ORF Transcript_23847/g.42316 Transcript_23847/m.42316 type:complete len:111 (+) Transcript_23847:173-505(+)
MMKNILDGAHKGNKETDLNEQRQELQQRDAKVDVDNVMDDDDDDIDDDVYFFPGVHREGQMMKQDLLDTANELDFELQAMMDHNCRHPCHTVDVYEYKNDDDHNHDDSLV